MSKQQFIQLNHELLLRMQKEPRKPKAHTTKEHLIFTRIINSFKRTSPNFMELPK
jgi:hypothetical protein